MKNGHDTAVPVGSCREQQVLTSWVDRSAFINVWLSVTQQRRQDEHRYVCEVVDVLLHRVRHACFWRIGLCAGTLVVFLVGSLFSPESSRRVTNEFLDVSRYWRIAQHNEPELLAVRPTRRTTCCEHDRRQCVIWNRLVDVAANRPSCSNSFKEFHTVDCAKPVALVSPCDVCRVRCTAF